MSTCKICPSYGRDGDGDNPPPRWTEPGWSACWACYGRTQQALKEIPGEYSQLDATPGGSPGDTRVSGSTDAPLGVRVAVLDLIVAAGGGTVHDPHGDQTGQLPVIPRLDSWVADWIGRRRAGEHRPLPTVPVLCGWLLDRLDWACQGHPAIDDFAGEVRGILGTLRAVNGHTSARPEQMVGVPCKRCDLVSLHRAPGDHYIACSNPDCGLLLTQDEYAAWVRLLAAAAQQQGRAA